MDEIGIREPLSNSDTLPFTTTDVDGEEHITRVDVTPPDSKPEELYKAIQDMYISGVVGKANVLATEGWKIVFLTAIQMPDNYLIQYTAVLQRPPAREMFKPDIDAARFRAGSQPLTTALIP